MWWSQCCRCGKPATRYLQADEKSYCSECAEKREAELVKFYQLTRTMR